MLEPKPIRGESPQANWMERIRNKLRAQRLLPGRGYRLKETPGGTFLEIEQFGGGTTKAGPGVTIDFFYVWSCQANYYWCYQGLLPAQGVPVLTAVAKPIEHRADPIANSSELIEGDVVHYSFVNNRANNADFQRTADDHVNPPQVEILDPVIHTPAIDGRNGAKTRLQCLKIPAGVDGLRDANNNPIVWMDMNQAGRYWAQVG